MRPSRRGAHDPRVSQEAELVRHGRFAEAELGGEVAHAQLRTRERVEDPDAGGVAEDAENLGEAFDGVCVEL